jgi:hypothetical protein
MGVFGTTLSPRIMAAPRHINTGKVTCDSTPQQVNFSLSIGLHQKKTFLMADLKCFFVDVNVPICRCACGFVDLWVFTRGFSTCGCVWMWITVGFVCVDFVPVCVGEGLGSHLERILWRATYAHYFAPFPQQLHHVRYHHLLPIDLGHCTLHSTIATRES